MFQDQSFLAVIGARGGSKGYRRKNLAPLAGQPLIWWTVRAALESGVLDRVVVSTDVEDIADAARSAGADVPFLRPEAISGDEAPMEAFVQHAVRWIEAQEGRRYDYTLCLQPTSPLRTAAHIREAITQYFEQRRSPEDSMVSVTPVASKFGWIMRHHGPGYIEFALESMGGGKRRQLLPEYFLPNGAIYMAPTARLLSEGFYTGQTLPFVMDEHVSIDIDTPKDMAAAEARIGSKGTT